MVVVSRHGLGRRLRRLNKAVRNHATYAVLWLTLWPLRTMPIRFCRPLARGFGLLGYLFFRRLRKRALRQVQAAFEGKLGPCEVKALVRRSFDHYALTYFEFVNSDRLFALCPEQVEFVGSEHLDSALAKGRGLIWISGHIGNWELMAAYISGVAGYKLNIITRSLYDSRLDRLLYDKRLGYGMNQIPRGSPKIFEEMVGALERNEILGFVMDQDVRVRGVFTDFFGRPAFTPAAPAFFALRFEAPVIGGFTARLPDGRHRITILPPIEITRTGDFEKDVEVNTARFNRIIEESIRQNPEQWVWIHRRWRTRPDRFRKKRQEAAK